MDRVTNDLIQGTLSLPNKEGSYASTGSENKAAEQATELRKESVTNISKEMFESSKNGASPGKDDHVTSDCSSIDPVPSDLNDSTASSSSNNSELKSQQKTFDDSGSSLAQLDYSSSEDEPRAQATAAASKPSACNSPKNSAESSKQGKKTIY